MPKDRNRYELAYRQLLSDFLFQGIEKRKNQLPTTGIQRKQKKYNLLQRISYKKMLPIPDSQIE